MPLQMHLHSHNFALLDQGTNLSELANAMLKFNNRPNATSRYCG